MKLHFLTCFWYPMNRSQRVSYCPKKCTKAESRNALARNHIPDARSRPGSRWNWSPTTHCDCMESRSDRDGHCSRRSRLCSTAAAAAAAAASRARRTQTEAMPAYACASQTCQAKGRLVSGLLARHHHCSSFSQMRTPATQPQRSMDAHAQGERLPWWPASKRLGP